MPRTRRSRIAKLLRRKRNDRLRRFLKRAPTDGEHREPGREHVPDNVGPATRSRIMSRVRSRDTAPELTVRSALHAAGYRYRLHRKDLPGSPDIVLPRYRTAVQVHGCFWHGHHCRRGDRLPSTNTEYWRAKIERNRERDREVGQALAEAGWRVVTIWECDLRAATEQLLAALDRERSHIATASGRRISSQFGSDGEPRSTNGPH